jgi:hypothetical protein
MPLKVGKPRTIATTVETIDGQSFGVTFKILPDDEIDALSKQGGNSTLRALITGLDDIVGEDDAALPFDAALEFVLSQSDIGLRLQRAYQKATIEAALGN